MADAVLRLLADSLGQGVPAVLLAVVDSDGSSPGKPGAKLALAADGRIAGTIGGGAVEHSLVETARALLREPIPSARLLRIQHDPASGMACGGSQTVALLPCGVGDLPAVLGWLNAEETQQPGCLFLSAAGLAFTPGAETATAFQDGDAWFYQETVAAGPIALLIGGGHVSLALSQILALLDFRVRVLEQRENVSSFTGNAYAHEKRQVDYAAIDRHIPVGERTYAIVMTHAHSLDELVLRQLLGRNVRYLGMLGSKTKTAAMLARLAQDFPAAALARVHAPAGLPIGSHSPTEIAVSIAAEMVAVRNGVA